MAKKKNWGSKRSKIVKKNTSKMAMVVLVCVLAAGIYVGIKPSVKVQPVAPATGPLIETRPV